MIMRSVSVGLLLLALVLPSLAAVTNTTTFKFKNTYPTGWAIPPTTSKEVKAWVAALNISAIPKLPVVKLSSAGDPAMPAGTTDAQMKAACDWTWDLCINGDITICPAVGDWGLTFDDGPTPYSNTLYDILDENNLKATLFLIGSNVITLPDVVTRAFKANHQLAVHTWSHHPLTSLTNEQIVAELKWTELAIKEVTGVTTRFYRPPYGDVDNRVRAIAAQLGYTDIIWDLDTDDWQLPPGGKATNAQVDAAFAKWIKARPTDTHGHITLEHDTSENSVAAFKRNLPALKKVFNLQPVASCTGETHPYKEDIIYNPLGLPVNGTASASVSVPVSVKATSPISGSVAAAAATNVLSTSVQSAADSLHSLRFSAVAMALTAVVAVFAL